MVYIVAKSDVARLLAAAVETQATSGLVTAERSESEAQFTYLNQGQLDLNVKFLFLLII